VYNTARVAVRFAETGSYTKVSAVS
jgi:hypothetical protein